MLAGLAFDPTGEAPESVLRKASQAEPARAPRRVSGLRRARRAPRRREKERWTPSALAPRRTSARARARFLRRDMRPGRVRGAEGEPRESGRARWARAGRRRKSRRTDPAARAPEGAARLRWPSPRRIRPRVAPAST